MWAYDLHLYTVAYFTRAPAPSCSRCAALVLAVLAPLFALGVRNASWKIQISRAATFQSLSVIAILVYLIAMMLGRRARWRSSAAIGRGSARSAIVFVMTLAALVLLPSAQAARLAAGRSLAKHLFEHRYDYRQEWLRFTDTVGRRARTARRSRSGW